MFKCLKIKVFKSSIRKTQKFSSQIYDYEIGVVK